MESNYNFLNCNEKIIIVQQIIFVQKDFIRRVNFGLPLQNNQCYATTDHFSVIKI